MNLSNYEAKPNKTIREHTDELLNNLEILHKLNYIKDNRIYELTKIACEYHDYGKANREFQKRIKNNTKFDENTEIVHNVLSLYFIDKSIFENQDDYYKVGFAVLNHHNYCDNFKMIEDEESKELIKSLLSDFKVYPIRLSTTSRIRKIAEEKDTILIKGILNKCDYSASGGIPIEYENNYLIEGLNNLLLKWKIKDNKAEWNELQYFCKENTDNNIMVVAPTGMGKTEAALHWIGNNKGFFILPLKTAINAIYKRVKEDILENKSIETRLALLHSDTLSYYNNDNNEMDIMDYYNQSKQLSMPLNISTLDQLFDFVFKYQGYELKLSTLSYSKVVIDEIQMYSPDLLAYLIYGIKKINKLGGKIAILTATLAPFVKDLLQTGDECVYFKEKTFTNDMKRHNLCVYDSEIDSEIIYKKFWENNRDKVSNKILVVCNTIKKAQQIYKELLEKDLTKVNILHSKFIKCDRAAKEKEILEFGKTEIIGEGIWISTQIVEASLDIDFDYLFTELSDISGLFQRLGRCNRKGKKSVDKPNCFVFLNIDKNLLTNGNKGFIDRKIYELSREALRDVKGLLTEEDKIKIINKYLTTENINSSDYKIKYDEFKNWIERVEPYQIDKKDINLRNIISFDVIPIQIYKEHKEEIDGNSEKLVKPINTKLDKKEVNKIKLEKINLKEEIKKYTVPVGIYDIYFSGKKTIVKQIQLSKNQFVNVVECEYNELGFIRTKNECNTGIHTENYDNFL